MSRPLSAKYSVELGYSFDTNLGDELMWWRNAVLHQDIDCTIVIDGKEGAGKSLLAQQVARFLDKDRVLTLDQVEFTFKSFQDRVRNIGKGRAVIYDEAGRSTDRRGSGSKENRDFNQFLRECRAYNVFLIIVMQSFYDMDMVSAVWRSRVLLNVDYKWDKTNPERPLVRGVARFYNEAAKKRLYTDDFTRRNYSYPFVEGSFDFRFPGHWVLDHEAYKEKKMKAELLRNSSTAGNRPYCEDCNIQMRYNRTLQVWKCPYCPREIHHEPARIDNMNEENNKKPKGDDDWPF